jgi:hypothetical protein
MSFAMGGNLIHWMVAGILWAISCWVFSSLFLLFLFRELVVRLPMIEATELGERLAESTKRLKYSVAHPTPYDYDCRPTRGLIRHLGCCTLQVRLHQGGIDLIGPAVVVNAVKKQLLAA